MKFDIKYSSSLCFKNGWNVKCSSSQSRNGKDVSYPLIYAILIITIFFNTINFDINILYTLHDIIDSRNPSCRCYLRADSRFAPSQWETALLCNDVSHWLVASPESTLLFYWKNNTSVWHYAGFSSKLTNRPNSQIRQCTCLISHIAPFRTDMWTS